MLSSTDFYRQEKPKRGRKRKESGSPNWVVRKSRSPANIGDEALFFFLSQNLKEANGKTNKAARVGSTKNETADMKSQSVCSDDSSEVELEIEYDDDDIEGTLQSDGAYHGAKLDTMKQEQRMGEEVLLDSKQATTRQEEQRPLPARYGNGSTTGSSLPPQPMADERSNGFHPHPVPSATLPHLGDDHLAHLYSDLEAAEHLSLVPPPRDRTTLQNDNLSFGRVRTRFWSIQPCLGLMEWALRLLYQAWASAIPRNFFTLFFSKAWHHLNFKCIRCNTNPLYTRT